MTPAKILLFGEYTVLVGSQALAIPYPNFYCHLTRKERGLEPNSLLATFIQHLLANPTEYPFLNLEKLYADWQQGLNITSTIPIQYGLGSSGAVTAEIYKNYAFSLDKPLWQIRTELASMEKFMHGSSSGIDPLVCFHQSPLLFTREGSIASVDPLRPTDIDIFLIDSHMKAATKNYVARFINDYTQNTHFFNQIQHLATLVNKCIDLFLEPSPQFIESIKNLSQRQLEIFPFLFPPTLVPYLNEGFEQKLFYPKLCGSGGGGFVLGFTQHKQRVQQYFDSKLVTIFWI